MTVEDLMSAREPSPDGFELHTTSDEIRSVPTPRKLKIALLNSDKPLPGMEKFGTNDVIFKAWFDILAETYWKGELEVVLDNYDVMEQIYPEKPEDYDVLCITGSDSAAFDDKEWIHTLADYIRFVRDTKPTKLISFCFGHQIVHHALNGIAEINPAGTEIGRVEVDLTKEAQVLLKTDKEKFGVYLGHRDHVAKLAPGFISLGSTPPTPHQGAICGNDMLTWQVHPELPAELMIGFLINQKNGTLTMNRGSNQIPTEQLDAWLDSYYTSPGSGELVPIDAIWCGGKIVSWILGNVLSDQELEDRMRKR